MMFFLDEADKAPIEVVCILKGLLEDGEVLLSNGLHAGYICTPSIFGCTCVCVLSVFMGKCLRVCMFVSVCVFDVRSICVY